MTSTHAATAAHLSTFAPLKWATSALTSPEWIMYERNRGAPAEVDFDRFAHRTLQGPDGITTWLECYRKPPAASKLVTKTMTLVAFGHALHGFPSICHGGATLAVMDEALSYGMIANVIEEMGYEGAFSNYGGEAGWKEALEQGKPPQEVLRGRMVTAKMEVKFLRPVLCPGVVGVQVDVVSRSEAEMRIRGVMRDGEGRPLMEAEGVWVKIGKRARL